MELRNDLLIHIASLSVDVTIIPHPAAVDTPFEQSFPFFCIPATRAGAGMHSGTGHKAAGMAATRGEERAGLNPAGHPKFPMRCTCSPAGESDRLPTCATGCARGRVFAPHPLVLPRLSRYNGGMKWYEIAVYTTDAGAEPVCGALTSAGLSGFSIEESRESAAAFLKESALYWDFADMAKIGADTPCVKAYLAVLPENEPVLDAARASIERLRGLDVGFDLGTLARTVTVRDDEDGAHHWTQY